MAETVVSFVSNRLVTLLQEEGSLLGGLRQEVQLIKDELGHMKAFLKVAEAKEDDDPRLQEWIKQVREAAYDIEDVLDEFVLRFAGYRHHGFCGSLQRILKAIKSLPARHQVASEIQSIKSRIKNISELRRRYQDEFGIDHRVTGSSTMNDSRRYSRDDALLVEEAKLVGIDQPKQHLISKLLEGHDHQLKVISVVGMAGLGKTTLVKKVHEDPEVRKNFPVRAWVTVSQTCNFPKLLRDLIRQLNKDLDKSVPQSIESMTTAELKEFVKDFLRRAGRYAIVFDDVWDVEFWNEIKFALPEGNYGNRVMLTTRNADVAPASCTESQDYVYKMEPLSIEDSWTLFCNKIFKGNHCPAHLMDVAKAVLDKCDGLPLAIVAIGGLLASKDVSRIDEWEKIQHSLGGELEGTGKLERVKRILSLSYNNLPSHLKPCLLYLTIYPEDDIIHCYRLINLWIAERFVEWREGMSIEDVAWCCLCELISRSLIQVTEMFYEGTPSFCRIHDLMREVILIKSREQNMVTVTTGQPITWPSEKVRRLAIHSSSNSSIIPHHQQRPFYSFEHLRSFIRVRSTNPLLSKTFLSEVLRSSKLLKVLDLEGEEIEETPNEVFNLLHLTYLNLYGTKVARVPQAIGKLQHLEYLNLGNTGVRELPVEILKLQKLRHLIVFQRVDPSSADYGFHGFKGPSKLGGLLSLQTLSTIDASSGSVIVKEIGKLTQLRELCITQLRREDGKELCSSLVNLTSLRQLSIASVGKGDDHEIIDLNHHQHSLSSSSSCSFLQSLRVLLVRGRLETMPVWITHLQNLVRLDLIWSGLRAEEDPLEFLQHLPNLGEISFCGSYQGERLCFKAGGFLKLKRLWLRRMEGLRRMTMEEGACPHLQRLILKQLPLLEDLPSGIQHLSHLQELGLYEMSSRMMEKVENQEEESEDYRRMTHIPEIVIGFYTDDGRRRIRRLWGKKKKKTILA
ncbi:disease resistance protein RPM1-like [Coffea eugenioides]|uniref:disease resistance protein RPM1-like n=1 Tax=Coffea eugenioides TaxID=49369 RepID=UPI000F610E71|nr:disease resistance protein RPM1-like [Coffea eugenioides]